MSNTRRRILSVLIVALALWLAPEFTGEPMAAVFSVKLHLDVSISWPDPGPS